jgi:hypothetical protein
MPYPSAYDPEIDDHHEPPDATLTPEQMRELATKLRNQLVEAHLQVQEPAGEN